MTSLYRLKYLLLLAILLLSACAVQTPPANYDINSPLWQHQQQQLRQIQHYQVRGMFAWIDTRQRVSANFFWQQNTADNYRLLLTNPLGSTEMDLRVNADGAQLTDKKGQIYYDSNPEQLISRLSGMNVPLHSLRQWLLGLPGEASDYSLDQHYRLYLLNWQQNGKRWQVRYQSYHHASANQPALPENIEITQGNLRIKLKLNHWTLS